MKIDIVGNPKDAIKGYKPVIVNEDGLIEMFDVSDSECMEIRANGIVDRFKASQLQPNLIALLKKVRIGGEIILSGLDCNIISRQLISGKLDEATFSHLVESSNSISSLATVAKIVQSQGLQIKAQKISGFTYQIVAKRG